MGFLICSGFDQPLLLSLSWCRQGLCSTSMFSGLYNNFPSDLWVSSWHEGADAGNDLKSTVTWGIWVQYQTSQREKQSHSIHSTSVVVHSMDTSSNVKKRWLCLQPLSCMGSHLTGTAWAARRQPRGTPCSTSGAMLFTLTAPLAWMQVVK